MTPLNIQGRVAGPHQLPCPPQHVSAGDTYRVGADMYAWDGRQWNCIGGLGESADFVQKEEYKLGHKGIDVVLWSEYDIASLFEDPEDLDLDDLAIFETTYPDDYKAFEQLWTDLRGKQLATGEINEWRDKYAKSE